MNNENQKERQRDSTRKYAQSEKGKAARKNLRQTDKYKQMQAEWRSRGGSKAEYERNKDTYANRDLIKRYGITLDDYYHMLEEQNECCYICGKHESNNSKNKKLAIDHNHTTGQIRKLLCHHCNSALGQVKENVDILKKMIEYIEEHNI